MQLALETQVLYELALSIGDSAELAPMLRHTTSEMLRLTNSNGAFVVQFGAGANAGSEDGTPTVACLLPRNVERHTDFRAFTTEWPHEALYRTLRERTEHHPLTIDLPECAAHAFLLPGFGFLVLFRRQGRLAENFLRAFGPLARKLGQTARACLVEEELRRQSWRLELATSSAHIGVWQFDPATGRQHWDAEMYRLFDVDPAEFTGGLDDFMSRVHPDDRARVGVLMADILAKDDTFDFEFGIVTRTGTRRQLASRGRVQRDAQGAVVTVVGVNVDVTARKETEDALRRARDLAEATNQAKSHFIANMSHELRTPLNGVIGMTELALESGLNDTQREYLRVARSSADSLLTILNDILDFSKIDAGEMLVESIPFSLPVVIGEALKSLSVRAQQKQLELVLDLPADLPAFSLGDPGRIRQIVLNLCDNALKFTQQGEIVVQVRAEPVDSDDVDLVSIEVRDSGIGIAPEKLEQIFDAFQQVDATITRRFGGTGLGLSISRRLAQLMGGQLTVQSAPGKGSTFTLLLPLARTIVETEVSGPPTRRWEGRRALIVDDHQLGRTTVSLWMRYWGFTTEEAADGADALRRLRETRSPERMFDVVVLDAMMPELDGFDVAMTILDEALLPPQRVVMLSSGGRRGDAARCREVGIAGFLTKPALPSEMREMLSRVFDARLTPPNGTELITRHMLKERPRARRVLLVEDNLVNQAVAQGMLMNLGYEVVIAGNGEEALSRMQDEQFDVVFMDMQMPVLDGVEATREIRKREGSGPRTPIVAMTANAMPEEKELCFAAGMDEHLAKPVRLATLQDVLQRFAPR